jgi:hypothetical protein
VYTQTGEVHSKRALDGKEPGIGRVARMEITPPRTVFSLKRCIARAERNPLYTYGDLYGDAREDTPWSNESHLERLGAGTVGTSALTPLLIVQPALQSGSYNLPMKVLKAQGIQLAITVCDLNFCLYLGTF